MAAAGGINLAVLSQILVTTLANEDAARKQVEKQLHDARRVAGFLPSLLTLVSHSGANDTVRQCAASQLKTAIKRYWDNESPAHPSPFSEADKAVVRANLVAAVLSSKLHAVTNFTIEALALVAMYDFPDRWPELVPQLVAALNAGDLQTVFLGTRIVRRLGKMYQYASSASGSRAPWEAVVQATFPRMASIFKQCLAANTLDAANMMRVILKCYWSASSFHLAGHLAAPEQVLLWLDMINTLLGKPLPEASEGKEPAGQPTEPHDRYNWPWWKCKKWCACILDRFMNRYGTPHWLDDGSEEQAASAYFHNNLMARLLPTVVAQLALRKNGRYCTDRVFIHCISYVKVSVEFGSCWKQLAGAQDFLLQDIILATLKFDAEDISLWSEDPDEFIRTYYAFLDDYFDPRVEAKNLLFYLTKARGKAFMPHLLASFNTFLTAYAAAPEEGRDWTVKEAVLNALGSMSSKLLGNESYRGAVPGMLAAHVVPELNSKLGPLRARAVHVIGEYVAAAFSAADWKAIVSRVVDMMRDPEAVVQYVASSAFSNLLKNVTTRDIIRPIVVVVLETLLTLVSRFKADDVVSSLGSVFTTFPAECAPQAPALAVKLVEFFVEFSRAAASAREGEGDHLEFAALNCLQAIVGVLDKTPYTPERWAALLGSTGSLALKLMDKEGEFVHWDYFQSAMDIMYNLAYATPAAGFTADHWVLFERAAQATAAFGADFVDVFATSVEPYICKGVDTLLNGKASNGQPYVQLLWGIHTGAVEKQSEDEQVYTSRIIISLIARATGGRLDALLPELLAHFVALGVGPTCAAKTGALKVACASVLAAAMLNNCALVVAWMEANGATLPVLQAMVATLGMSLSLLDKKIAALGLLELARNLPPTSPVLAEVVATAGRLAYQHKHQITGDEEEDSDEEGGGGGGGGAIVGAGSEDSSEDGAEDGEDGPVILGEVELADDDSVDHTFDQEVHRALATMPLSTGMGEWEDEIPDGPSPENVGSSVIEAISLPATLYDVMCLPHLAAGTAAVLAALPDDAARLAFNEVYTAGQAVRTAAAAGAGI